MVFFILFLIVGAFAAAATGVSAAVVISDAHHQAEQSQQLQREGERIEEECRRQQATLRQEAENAEAQRRLSKAKGQAAEEAAMRAQNAREVALHLTMEEERRQKEVETSLLNGIPPAERPRLADIRCMRLRYSYQRTKFNVAIVGESGMGKSSFLNAVRGILPGEPGAALTGFNESTTEVRGYPDPRHPSIVWYDVPGADPPLVSGWRYFTHQGLYIFDALVVVFCDRFTQTAGTLIANARACNIPVFLVRTKADQIIRNIQADGDGEVTEEEARAVCLAETERMVNDNLTNLGLPHRRTYVVSRAGMENFVAKEMKGYICSEDIFLDDLVSLSSEKLLNRF